MTDEPRISFEFFPPRDDGGRDKLVDTVAAKLETLNPEFFSVTYGAGGSTRDGTRQTVQALMQAGHEAVPHLSMGNDDPTDVQPLLDVYAESGVKQIVTLRGDQPSGFGANKFSNNAEALVKLIRQHSGDRFHLIVAAYPEVHPDAMSATSDFDFFRSKVEAGADSAITQFFYNAEAYYNFMNRCEQAGISIPVYPGIMPITNAESLFRFAGKVGADVPRWLRYEIEEIHDENDLRDFGVEVVSRLCETLMGMGAPGLHFYTLNRWGASTRICSNLGLAA